MVTFFAVALCTTPGVSPQPPSVTRLALSFSQRATPRDASHLVPQVSSLVVTVRKQRDFADCSLYTVTFPSPVRTRHPPNNTVWCELFRPKGEGPFPGAVVLHFLNDPGFLLTRLLCHTLAARGIAACLLTLPYYGKRQVRSVPPAADQSDLKQVVVAWCQGIQDARCALAYLRSRKDIDPARSGLVGISLGALIGAVAVAVDSRVEKAALILGGGNLGDILASAPEVAPLRQALRSKGIGEREIRRILSPIEPLNFASPLAPGTVLMINAEKDKTVPPRCARALARAFGGVAIHWYPTGHTGLAAYWLAVTKKTARFFLSVK